MSAAQIDLYERWGLIHREPDGSWPVEDTVERIRRIHEVAEQDKRLLPLPRRTVYLRATNDHLLFDIPNTKIADALLGMPEIRFSYQKLQRVHAAYARMGDRARGSGRQHGAKGRRARPWLPRQSQWRPLLQEEFKRGALQNRVTGFFHWDRLFPIYGSDLRDIPAEERIYLIAIVDAFRWRGHASKFDSQASQ